MSDREHHHLQLVDDNGITIGKCRVDEAHQPPGRHHRAFSVVLHDRNGRLLLQQRATAKTRFALRWANSCCGHPLPGQELHEAAARRLREELGVTGINLTEVGVHHYRAEDAATNRVEHEYDHVLVGAIDSSHVFDPDPTEVAALRWMDTDELATDLTVSPERYAPWLSGILDVWRASTAEQRH